MHCHFAPISCSHWLALAPSSPILFATSGLVGRMLGRFSYISRLLGYTSCSSTSAIRPRLFRSYSCRAGSGTSVHHPEGQASPSWLVTVVSNLCGAPGFLAEATQPDVSSAPKGRFHHPDLRLPPQPLGAGQHRLLYSLLCPIFVACGLRRQLGRHLQV